MKYHKPMLNFKSICFGLGLFALTFPFSLSAKEVMTWAVLDFPPVYILDGAFKGKGFHQKYMRHFQKLFPEYEHETLVAKDPRIQQLMREKKRVCYNASIWSEEWAKVAHKSLIFVIVPAHGIVTRKAVYEKHFQENQMISLKQLLQTPEIKFGYAEGRSYGPINMPLIEQYKSDTTYIYKGKSVSRNLLKMLLSQRIHATVEYPWLIAFDLRELGQDFQQIKILQISELGDNQFIWSPLACTKNEWGQQVIERVNAYLLNALPTEEWRGIFEEWLDADSIPHYRQGYKKVILGQLKE